MKIAIILNGISRKKKKFSQHVLPVLQQKFSVEVFETQLPDHAVQLAEAAAINGYNVVLSAGGDGTLNQVVNGILKANAITPTLGVIPLGSGNDFAGMMGLTDDPRQITRLLSENIPLPVDVGKIFCFNTGGDSVVKYFINVCSLGMGPATVHRLERLPRWMGSSFRYYASVLTTFLTHPTERFEVRTPHWT